VRELFLAGNVGISGALDALIIGMTLPTTVALAFSGGATRAIVPAYSQLKKDMGLSSARRMAGVVVSWVGLGGLLMWLLLHYFAPTVVDLTGPGLSSAGKESAVGYLELLAPVAFVTSVSGILSSILQAEEVFAGLALGTILTPGFTLGIMLVGWNQYGLGALALGTLVGPTVTLSLYLFIMFRRSILPRLGLWGRGLGLTTFARHAVPISISLGLLQINVVVDSAIATLIGPGAVSALRYANTLLRAPIGVISNAWGTAIYPALVNTSHGDKGTDLGKASSSVLRYVVSFFVPIAMLSAAVAPLAVSTAYGRGEFTAEGLALTSQALAALAPLMLLIMYQPVLTSALNARRKGTVLLVASVLDIMSHVTLTLTLGKLLGVVGVALASSLATVVTTIYFSRQLSRIERNFQQRPLFRTLILTMVAVAPGAAVIGALCWSGAYLQGPGGGLLTLTVYGIAGVLSYIGMSYWLGVPETRAIVGVTLQWIARRRLPRASS
jgi:putative peptidoglycan lipid II flippase